MAESFQFSEDLIRDAKVAAKIAGRSIAEQIEFWARLGQAIEPILQGCQAWALRRAGAAVSWAERMASVDSPAGHRRVADYLDSRPAGSEP